eukprot:13846084-Alexandrium_andersonii.AAC.1
MVSILSMLPDKWQRRSGMHMWTAGGNRPKHAEAFAGDKREETHKRVAIFRPTSLTDPANCR